MNKGNTHFKLFFIYLFILVLSTSFGCGKDEVVSETSISGFTLTISSNPKGPIAVGENANIIVKLEREDGKAFDRTTFFPPGIAISTIGNLEVYTENDVFSSTGAMNLLPSSDSKLYTGYGRFSSSVPGTAKITVTVEDISTSHEIHIYPIET